MSKIIFVIISTYKEKKNISKISKKPSKLKIVSEATFVDYDISGGSLFYRN